MEAGMANSRSNLQRLVRIVALTALTIIGVAPARGQDIKYREDPEAAKRMTQLLKDWDPKPMVHLKARGAAGKVLRI
jgi:hypothetical protein